MAVFFHVTLRGFQWLCRIKETLVSAILFLLENHRKSLILVGFCRFRGTIFLVENHRPCLKLCNFTSRPPKSYKSTSLSPLGIILIRPKLHSTSSCPSQEPQGSRPLRARLPPGGGRAPAQVQALHCPRGSTSTLEEASVWQGWRRRLPRLWRGLPCVLGLKTLQALRVVSLWLS